MGSTPIHWAKRPLVSKECDDDDDDDDNVMRESAALREREDTQHRIGEERESDDCDFFFKPLFLVSVTKTIRLGLDWIGLAASALTRVLYCSSGERLCG